MVEPSWRASRACVLVAALAGCLGLAGCSYVPRARLDECHRLSQTLQAENSRLKDTALSLRSQNEDLNQRAIDEERRLRVQEEEIRRLVQSVSAYQDERDKLAAAFERIKAAARSSADTVTSGLRGRIEDLARAHPGWEFDPERDALTIPAAELFDASSTRLRTEARALLREMAPLWDDPEARDLDLLIVGRNETSPVRLAGLQDPEESVRALGRARAAQVRDLLTTETHLDPRRVEVAGFEVPHVEGDVPDVEALARNRRIEIHLRPRASGPAAAPIDSGAAAARSDP